MSEREGGLEFETLDLSPVVLSADSQPGVPSLQSLRKRPGRAHAEKA